MFNWDRNKNGEEGQNGAVKKLKQKSRRRHQKGNVRLLNEIKLKFRKTSSLKLKKNSAKDVKKLHTLPCEILQLGEVVGCSNPLKIKLYTLSGEHLGYPSDLRSNFPFDPRNFLLKTHLTNGIITTSKDREENQGKIIYFYLTYFII